MSFTRWLRNLRSVIAPAGLQQLRRFGPEHRKPAARYRPRIEVLEDRLTPSTLTVTTPLDAVDLNDGLFSLREAILAASSGDQITFDQSLSGSTINLDPARGQLLINKDLDILGLGANNLAVSGQNLSRVFEIAFGATDTISGLTIKNGKAAYGGGILNDGTLTLSDSIVSGNFVTSIGGGIYNSGTATISGTTLSGNRSTGRFGTGGGAITNDGDLTLIGSVLSDNSAYDGGAIQNYVTMTITGTTFSGNHGQRGGVIYNRYDALTISDSALSDNSAVFGGAIYNESTLTVSGSTLSRNSATSSGGAIYNVATMTVSGSTLSGNSASSSGGGIYNDGKLTVDSSSTLSGNSSVSGGGIYNFFRGTVKVSASTLSRNSATNNGGGVYNFDRGSVSLSNSTLTGNSATHGGGIYNPYGTLTLSNSTLSGNSATIGGGGIHIGFVDFPGAFIGNTATLTVRSSIVAGNSGNCLSPDLYQRSGLPTPTVTNSLIGDNSGSTLVEAPVGTPDANGNVIGGPIYGVIDPMLKPLGYNGGPTQTMALRAGSPALDTGANADGLSTDQRGQPFARTAGSRTDMGAFELQLVLLTPTVSVSNAGGTFNGSPFPAVATVAGVGGPFTASLAGVTPTLTYYAGPTAVGPALAGAPTNAGTYTVVAAYASSPEYTSASATTTFTIARAMPTFIAMSSATTLAGKISLGALVPTGSVAIAVGAVTVSAAIHADGTFSASLPTGHLPAGTYTITYTYLGDANFKPARATQTLVVLSAQQQIALIVNQVNALVTAGILDSGNGNALIVKLNNAIASLNSGNTTAGVNQLNAVINQVNAFVKSGKLTSTDAQAILSAINEAIAVALASPI